MLVIKNTEVTQRTAKRAAVRILAAKSSHENKSVTNIYENIITRFFYYAIVFMIIMTAFKIYFLWLDAYRYSHPAIFQVESGIYTEELPFEGVLLWEEKIIHASNSGVISYPSTTPRRVRKGEILCSINGIALSSPEAGYFSPALDGHEGDWNYINLWQGTSPLPSPSKASSIPNGTRVNNNQPIGKLIPKPQELRAIAWLDITPSLEQDIERGRIKIKRNENDWGLWAEIRTTGRSVISQKIKIYVNLPFFTPEMTEIRAFSWKINVGDRNGIYVPNSSVIFKDGVMGVFIIKGNEAIFKEVEAFHADENNIFITNGVIPGDILIQDAGSAREGQVNVW